MPRNSRLNKTTVIIAAMELANSNGLDQLNLKDLAKKLNIKSPSLYNHINGLAELKKDLAVKAIKALVDKMKDETVGKSGPDALRAMARAYLEYVRENPGMVTLIAKAPDKENEEAMEIDQDFVRTGMAIMAGFNLEQTDSIHGLRAIRCAVHGFALLELEQGFGFAIDPNESFEWMINQLISGINSRAKS